MVARGVLCVCRRVVVGEGAGGICSPVWRRRFLLSVETEVARAPCFCERCLGPAARDRSGGDVVWTSDRETWLEFRRRVFYSAPLRALRVEQVQASAGPLVFSRDHSPAGVAVDSLSNCGPRKGQTMGVARER